MTLAASSTAFFLLGLLPFIITIVAIVGIALSIYLLILLIQVLRLSIKALEKYLH